MRTRYEEDTVCFTWMREILEFIHYTSHSLFVVLIRSQTWTRCIESNRTWNLKFTRPSPMFPWFRLPLPVAVHIYIHTPSTCHEEVALLRAVSTRREGRNSSALEQMERNQPFSGERSRIPAKRRRTWRDAAKKCCMKMKFIFSRAQDLWSRGGREDSEEDRERTRITRIRKLVSCACARCWSRRWRLKNGDTFHLTKQLRSHTGANQMTIF